MTDWATLPSGAKTRVLLYAIGASGIGQTKRAVRIAEYVTASHPDTDVLVVTGAARAIDIFGQHASRRIVACPEAIALFRDQSPHRVAAATTALCSLSATFRPDVLISTSHAGVAGELRPLLAELHARDVPRILALRDIYSPPRFETEFEALTTADFTRVLIAGHETTCVPPAGLLEGDLGERTTFAGYLRPIDGGGPSTRPSGIWCQVGGGRDGFALADAFVNAAERLRDVLPGSVPRIATGFRMPPAERQELEAMTSGTGISLGFWDSDPLRSVGGSWDPKAMVAMAGYNTCVEAAWRGLPTVLCPRHDPADDEQRIRATWFAERFPNIELVSRPDPELIVRALERASLAETYDQGAPEAFFAEPTEIARMIVQTSLVGK